MGNIGKYFATFAIIAASGTYGLMPRATYALGIDDIKSALDNVKCEVRYEMECTKKGCKSKLVLSCSVGGKGADSK